MEAFLLFVIAILVGYGYVERHRNRVGRANVSTGAIDAVGGQLEIRAALRLSFQPGECDFHILGESNYQPELRRIAKSGRMFVYRNPPFPRTRMRFACAPATVTCASSNDRFFAAFRFPNGQTIRG